MSSSHTSLPAVAGQNANVFPLRRVVLLADEAEISAVRRQLDDLEYRKKQMRLFDIRTDDSHARFIAAVNQWQEDEPVNSYLSQFGLVGSAQWLTCLERGELPIEELTGKVSYSGFRVNNFGETENVIEFVCGEQIIGYDRRGCWDVPILVGDQVSVTRTTAEWNTRTGPVRCIIDLWAEWHSKNEY